MEALPLDLVPAEVVDIARKLASAGHEAWFVGGGVRDALLLLKGRARLKPGDADIATSATPDEVRAVFRRTVPIGVEHGTVAVLDANGLPHEVTTFRRDVRTDGRHAEVEFGVSLDDDLARRDFTINAIAVHPVTGELKDPFGGRADLDAGLVRAVGDAATRFREDRLRVLRALRFAATLEFTIEPGTWTALLEAAAGGGLDNLSRERVRDEWVKTLSGASSSRTLGLWRTAGVLERVWPELATLPPARDPGLDEIVPHDPVLITAAAMARAGARHETAQAAARRLRFSNRDAERVGEIVAGLIRPIPDAADERAIRRWLALMGAGAALDIASAAAPPRVVLQAKIQRMLDQKTPLSVADLAVTGEDLLAAGIPRGPAVGATLKRLLDAVIDDPRTNTRETLLAMLRGKPGA